MRRINVLNGWNVDEMKDETFSCFATVLFGCFLAALGGNRRQVLITCSSVSQTKQIRMAACIVNWASVTNDIESRWRLLLVAFKWQQRMRERGKNNNRVSSYIRCCCCSLIEKGKHFREDLVCLVPAGEITRAGRTFQTDGYHSPSRRKKEIPCNQIDETRTLPNSFVERESPTFSSTVYNVSFSYIDSQKGESGMIVLSVCQFSFTVNLFFHKPYVGNVLGETSTHVWHFLLFKNIPFFSFFLVAWK